jgi:ketosteroid isomerase-like protein
MKSVKPIIWLLILAASLLLISCETKQPAQNNAPASLKTSDLSQDKTFKETCNNIFSAVLAGNYEEILKYYTEDAVIAHNFYPSIKGKEAIRKTLQKQKELGVKFHSFNSKIDSLWECGSNLFEYGSYGMSVSTKETSHPYAYTGSYFTIWEKGAGNSFRMKYAISNLDFYPGEPFYK